MKLSKTDRKLRIRRRIRKISFGTEAKPRLSVFRSNKEIYVQLIDDNKGVTLLRLLLEIRISMQKEPKARLLLKSGNPSLKKPRKLV